MLLGITVVLRLYLISHSLEMLELIGTMQPEQYINLQPLMFQLQQVHNRSAVSCSPVATTPMPRCLSPQVQNLSAVSCLMLFIKAFQYLALVPQAQELSLVP